MPKYIHSFEYINDSRFLWWNRDYLRLVLRRIDPRKQIRNVADFGVGAGHWSIALVGAHSSIRRVVGVDNETHWCVQSQAAFEALKSRVQFSACCADAKQSDLPGDSFDLVTCQTLLLHTTDPNLILREMYRVLRPGGTLLCVEPVNFLNRALAFELARVCTPKERAVFFATWMQFNEITREKSGDQDIGLRLPELLLSVGCSEISVYLNDRVNLICSSEFQIDWVLDEIEKPAVKALLTRAGVKSAAFKTMRAVIRRIGERIGREKIYFLEAPKSIICYGKKESKD